MVSERPTTKLRLILRAALVAFELGLLGVSPLYACSTAKTPTDAAASDGGDATGRGDSRSDAGGASDSEGSAPGDASDGEGVDGGDGVSPGVDATLGGPGGGVEAGVGLDGGVLSCGDGGWCWCSPSPTGNDLNSVWSSSTTAAWAVGDLGTILRFDGQSWMTQSRVSNASLGGVWGSGANDVWAVGDMGTITHWDGARWTLVTSPTALPLRGVWGRAANDVWAVGGTFNTSPVQGVVLHWNGSSWSQVDSPMMIAYSAWASSPTDVYVAGGDGVDSLAKDALYPNTSGVLRHWDGAHWSNVTLPITQAFGFTSVWGSSASDVWATGAHDYAFHYKAGVWTYTSGNSDAVTGAASVSGTSASDVWTSNGYHWNGSAWSAVGDSGQFTFARTTTDVWTVGTMGMAAHFDGSMWTQNSPVTTLAGGGFERVWASGPNDAYLLGENTYLHWDGQGWTSFPNPLNGTTLHGMPASQRGQRIGGSSAADVWMVATMQVGSAIYVDGAHWNGASWSLAEISTCQDVQDVFVTGPNDAWAVANRHCGGVPVGETYHWNGTSWSIVNAGPAGGAAIWASSASDVWIFNATSGTAHWNGSAWSQPASAPPGVSAWGSSPDDLWAIASASSSPPVTVNMEHWNGVVWSSPLAVPFASVYPTDWSLRSSTNGKGATIIRGGAPNDVWVMMGGLFSHWDGSSWTPSAVSDPSLLSLTLAPGGAGWAIGSSPQVLLCRQ